MSNFIFILTEGDHDVAFLYRILKSNEVETYNIAIKDYPEPINKMFMRDLSSSVDEELNIDAVNSRFLPQRVMRKNNDILCIYKTTGAAQEEKRRKVIKTINEFIPVDSGEISAAGDNTFSILFFFDADKEGIDKRISQVRNELKTALNDEAVCNVNNKEVLKIKNLNIGLFIFTGEDNNTGSLEDILIMLMKNGNEDIFIEAEKYLDIHENTALFRNKVEYDGKIKNKVNGKKYYHKKSLIGTIGQLQMSGKSNTVCITDADYLTNEKIKSERNCNEIFLFIKKVMIY